MISILDKKLLFIIFLLVVVFLGSISFVYADEYGLEETAKEAGLKKANVDVKARTQEVLNAVLGFLGFIAVIIVIYGGVLWMTSAGNEQQVKKAKDTLKAGIIGLVVILCAWLIVIMTWNILMGKPFLG